MKYTLFKKNDLQKILLIALALVGFSSYVFSAPGTSPFAPTPSDVAPLINASNTEQSKNCNPSGLPNTTLSLCHDGGTPTQGFATESLVSSGPIVAESSNTGVGGFLIADLSQAVASVPTAASPFFDALRLTTGKNQNITTITLGSSGPAILGVWSSFLNAFAEGRLGRLDAEKLILTEKNSFASWSFGPVRTPANPLRTTSYTSTVGALPNIDIAGTTNLGQGNYCYRGYRDCSGGANSAGGGNMYISRVGRNYTACRDIDPAEFPQVDDMTDPGYFTCGEDRVAPASLSTSIKLIGLVNGYGYSGNGALCIQAGYTYAPIMNVSQQGGTALTVYMDAEDTFNVGTMVFADPYLERPIANGWHAGGFTNATDLPGFVGGNGWFETQRGAVTQIGTCSNQQVGTTWYPGRQMYIYNE